jgi:hypothetical protein
MGLEREWLRSVGGRRRRLPLAVAGARSVTTINTQIDFSTSTKRGRVL